MAETPQPPVPPGTPPPAEPTAPVSTRAAEDSLAGYPVELDLDRQDAYVRLLPFVKWLLAIPHLIVLFFLWIGALFAVVIAWFAVLITRRYPRGLFNFVVGVSRWWLRASAYVLLLTDRYPRFTLKDDPGYPLRFDITYPEEGVARWRPLFAWLIAFPYAAAAGVLVYLVYLFTFYAFFTILFRKRYPEGMFDMVRVALRWQARANAYSYFMTTRYPPFAWG